MRKAAVYAPRRSALSERDGLIQDGIATAFAALADLDLYCIDGDRPAGGPPPGLMHVSEAAPVIALGRMAHVALSHVRKRTLATEDLENEGFGDDDIDEEIEALVWSSVNTIKIVALGEPAWHSVQLLPVAVRRFYHVPPLRMIAADSSRRGVLVIDHGEEGSRARAVAGVLEHAGFDVRCAGRSGSSDGWSDDSRLHIHVGEHTLGAEELRLVDSWHSDRLVVQLDETRGSRTEAYSYSLMVDDNGNGFVCETPHDVVAACNELLEDHVLQRKVVAVGQNSVAPLLKAWQAIAEDLLS